jgi:hypothetical protein
LLLIKTVGNFLSDEGVVGEFKVKAEIGGPIVVRFPILLIYLAANQYKINAEDKTILFVFLQYVENQCTFLRVGQSSYSKGAPSKAVISRMILESNAIVPNSGPLYSVMNILESE